MVEVLLFYLYGLHIFLYGLHIFMRNLYYEKFINCLLFIAFTLVFCIWIWYQQCFALTAGKLQGKIL